MILQLIRDNLLVLLKENTIIEKQIVFLHITFLKVPKKRDKTTKYFYSLNTTNNEDYYK